MKVVSSCQSEVQAKGVKTCGKFSKRLEIVPFTLKVGG